MAISFPSNPTVGQQYTDTAANITWEWNGSSWASLPPSSSSGIGLTSLSVTQSAVGTAALSYNNSSGAFSYTPPDLSSYLTAESDTLADVTSRGATTNQTISFSASSNGISMDTASNNAFRIYGLNNQKAYITHAQNNGAGGAGDLVVIAKSGLYVYGGTSETTSNLGLAVEPNQARTILYYQGSSKLTTTNAGIDITGHTETDTLNVSGVSTFSDDINLSEANVVLGLSGGSSDDRLKFHTSEIYQDTNSFKIISNTGGITLRGGSVNSWSNASGAEEYIVATENGSVDLYYDNSKKLETTTGGVKITGESKSDSIALQGRSFSIQRAGAEDVLLTNAGTGGEIRIKAAGNVEIQSYQGSVLLKTNTSASTSGGLSLYYAISQGAQIERLTTTSNGVDINGSLTVNSNLTVSNGSVQVGSGQSFGSSTGSAAVYYGDGSNLTGVGGGSGLSSRSVVSATTGSVSVGATTNLNITGFKSYGLLKIGTNAASWVRLYVDDASRTSDANRSYLEDPLPGSGLIAEARSVSSGSNSFIMSPGIIGWNNDSTTGSTIYLSVTNNETSSSAITVDLTVVKLED